LGLFSFGFEPSGLDEGIEVIDNALIEAIELRSLGVVDSSIRADGAEKAGGKLTQRQTLHWTLHPKPRPRPERGSSLQGRSARHRAALIQIRRRRSSNYLTMIEDR
jgi:hypothetical protein